MRRKTLLAAGAALVLALATQLPAAADTRPDAKPGWTGTWATAHQLPMPGNDFFGPNWSMDGFTNQTLRQAVRISTGGALLRIRLSNLYGTTPLRITGATVGQSAGGAAVRPGTLRPLAFGHRPSTVIPVGGHLASDAVPLATKPLDTLAVTLYFAAPTGKATYHQAAFTTSYRATADHRFDTDAAAFADTTRSWYFLSGVDVIGKPSRGSVVSFGDSITDGYTSTPNANNRWPDELAERLVAARKPLGVLNTGIGGNMVMTDFLCFAGESALNRFHRDVITQPGVRTVIIFEGINDIGFGGKDLGCGSPPPANAALLIDAHRKLIHAAHARKIRVVGATITPFKGFTSYYNPQTEAVRDAVNQWIRTSGEYDSVVDFDRVVASPADPDALNPAYDGGDHLHPNDAGFHAMAAAIDIGRL